MYLIVFALLIIAALVAWWVWSSFLVLNEYERAVVFRLGHIRGEPKGPGPVLLLPFVDRAERVDLRTISLTVPSQEVITKDNVPVRVNAFAHFNVVDATAAVTRVQHYKEATVQFAQTTLRSTLGQHQLDELLTDREEINAKIQRLVDEQTAPWGIKIDVIEIRDVEIPNAMQRAMARQAEAERERRAKVISAQGEFEASAKLSEAAAVLAAEPISVQLRYLQTLIEMSSERTSTIVVPIPVELLHHFGKPKDPEA